MPGCALTASTSLPRVAESVPNQRTTLCVGTGRTHFVRPAESRANEKGRRACGSQSDQASMLKQPQGSGTAAVERAEILRLRLRPLVADENFNQDDRYSGADVICKREIASRKDHPSHGERVHVSRRDTVAVGIRDPASRTGGLFSAVPMAPNLEPSRS